MKTENKGNLINKYVELHDQLIEARLHLEKLTKQQKNVGLEIIKDPDLTQLLNDEAGIITYNDKIVTYSKDNGLKVKPCIMSYTIGVLLTEQQEKVIKDA